MSNLDRPRALVTGGAGLIGSHLADLLLAEGWRVRILDNLEPQTHRHGRPSWIPDRAEFIQADVRDRPALAAALVGIDVVFHQAAYGGYMPEIGKYVAVNSLGTAQLLEIIRDDRLPVRKVVVASSQVVYSEGAAVCPQHDLVFPPTRGLEHLARGDYQVYCPHCGGPTSPIGTPEHAPLSGETIYAITKVDQERLALTWARQTGIPTVALRYACTYGPRQSIFNPYTGVIAIFATRLLNGLAPVIYEDGLQTRDFCFVEDIARANLAVATCSALDGQAVNVGTGRARTIRELAETIGLALGVSIAPELRGEFRPGEIRHMTADTTRLESTGWRPDVPLEDGIGRYLDWIRSRGDIRDYFSEAEAVLRDKRIVHRATTAGIGTRE